MRAAAGDRMIVPGPARRHVDLEGDLAAQASAGGGFAECDGFCLFLFRFFFGKHGRALSSGLVIAKSEATKQSILSSCGEMDCFAALAMTPMVHAFANASNAG
jgi:hypothetical protein